MHICVLKERQMAVIVVRNHRYLLHGRFPRNLQAGTQPIQNRSNIDLCITIESIRADSSGTTMLTV